MENIFGTRNSTKSNI